MNAPRKPELEELTFTWMLSQYEQVAVPQDVPADDFTRVQIQKAYGAGMGAMVVFAQRLDREPAGRRAAILDSLRNEILAWGLAIEPIAPGAIN